MDEGVCFLPTNQEARVRVQVCFLVQEREITLFFLIQTKMHTPPLHLCFLPPVSTHRNPSVPRSTPPPPSVHLAAMRDVAAPGRSIEHQPPETGDAMSQVSGTALASFTVTLWMGVGRHR